MLIDGLVAEPPAAGTVALVVACGLGDDAEELARRGCVVEAFDVLPTAIEIAYRSFPNSSVTYRVADLFELPLSWRERFELIAETAAHPGQREGRVQLAAPTGPATLLRRNGSTTRATAAGSSANGQ